MKFLPTVHMNWCTHRFKARFTLNPTLSFCTVTSIKATTSSSSAVTIASIRVSQRVFSRPISVKEHQYVSQAFKPELTLESYPHTRGPRKCSSNISFAAFSFASLDTSILGSSRLRCFKSVPTSIRNWSYLVKTAMTGTSKVVRYKQSQVSMMTHPHLSTGRCP